MPHVDEGTLNALLDGALKAEDPARARAVETHLEGCPDCRALLGEAADLRARAAGILGAAAPLARPDFQEVLTRAGLVAARADGGVGGDRLVVDPRRPARHRRQTRAIRAIAWAATIVLALGTGYLIRDRLVTAPADMSAAARSDAQLERAAADIAAPERQPAPEVGRGGAPAIAPQGTPAGPAARPAPSATSPSISAHRLEERRDAALARTADAALATGAVGTPVAPAVVEDQVTEPLGAPTVVATAPPPRAPGAGEAEIASIGRRREGPAVAGEALALRALPAPPVPATLPIEGVVVVAGWRPITIAEASAAMDGPVYVLPGAHVVRLEAAGVDPVAEIRSVQRMEGGVDVRVTQRRADGAEPETVDVTASVEKTRPETDVAREAEAVNVASVRLDGYWLTVAGALPADALQALAASAKPAEGP